MSFNRKRAWFAVRLAVYGLFLLLGLGVAVLLPNMVKARWESSGVQVTFKLTVLDARTGQTIPGARVVIWISEEPWAVNREAFGHISATTDARGTCEIYTHFPGSGSGRRGRLTVHSTIWVRADGYEPWQKQCRELLGTHIEISPPFLRTNSYEVRVPLSRK